MALQVVKVIIPQSTVLTLLTENETAFHHLSLEADTLTVNGSAREGGYALEVGPFIDDGQGRGRKFLTALQALGLGDKVTVTNMTPAYTFTKGAGAQARDLPDTLRLPGLEEVAVVTLELPAQRERWAAP